MVNKAEQPQDNIQEPVSPATDITEEFTGADTPPEGTVDTPQLDPTTDQSSETPEVPEGEPTPPVIPEVPDAQTPPPAAEVPPTTPKDDLEKRMQDIEQQNLQYRQQQARDQMTQATAQYRQKLEGAGYLPDQAKEISDAWAIRESEIARVDQERAEQVRFLQGQANAAEHYAKQYGLQLDALTELRKQPDPASMETVAKRIKSDREKDAEIARLRAQLVPSQTYDDNQSTPSASNDEDRWLEKYNQGDRSDQASAAARRAAGLG